MPGCNIRGVSFSCPSATVSKQPSISRKYWATYMAQSKELLTVAVLILVAAFALYWPQRAKYLYDTDSVGFARGAVDYNIARGQPHPPGFPIWIVLVRATALIAGSSNTAMVLLSIGFTSAGAIPLYCLATRLQGSRAGVLVVVLLLLTPNVLLFSQVALSYTVDILNSALLGWLSARLLQGEKRVAPWTAGIVALLAGIRESGVILMVPLVGCAMLWACRKDWKLWLMNGLVGAVVVLLWIVPTACITGVADLWDFHYSLLTFLTRCSVLYHNETVAHLERAMQVGIWLSMSMVLPLTLVGASWLARKCLVNEEATPNKPAQPIWHHWAFYSLWLLPNLVILLLGHCPKPAYLNLSLPPLLLLAGCVLDVNLRTLNGRYPSIYEFTLGGFVLASVLLVSLPTGLIPRYWPRSVRHAVEMGLPQNIRNSDQTVEALVALTAPHREPTPSQIVIWLPSRLNYEKVAYYCDYCPVLIPFSGGLLDFHKRAAIGDSEYSSPT